MEKVVVVAKELALGNRSEPYTRRWADRLDKARGGGASRGLEGNASTWVRRFAQLAEALSGLRAAPP